MSGFRGGLAVCMLAAAVLLLASDASAGRFLRRGGSRPAASSAFGGVRPVAGYGANIHRNAVLKVESRRARRGLPVRNRGNIRWRR